MPNSTRDNYASVIFLHWGANKYRSQLARASLKSLQKTIHSSVEIIVVDNGGNVEDSKFFVEEADEKNVSLYIRNADNMHYSFGKNQGFFNSTANWLAMVDNDIIYKDGWLELCITNIKNCPDRKLVASPINYPYVHKRDKRWRRGQIKTKTGLCNLTERAGGNCRVMKRETFEKIGGYSYHYRSGSLLVDRLINAGYLCITPEVNYAWDGGGKAGFNYKRNLGISRTLSDGSKIDFINDKTFNNYYRIKKRD